MTRNTSTRTAAWSDFLDKAATAKRIAELSKPAVTRAHLLEGSQEKRGKGKKFEPKVRSDLQSLALRKIAEAGLPEPEEELADIIPGRRFRFDLGWRDKRVLVELNGGVWSRGASGHSSGTGIQRDYEKAALCQLQGYRVFSVSSAMVKDGTLVKWLRLCL